jgi:hypothetical protein
MSPACKSPHTAINLIGLLAYPGKSQFRDRFFSRKSMESIEIESQQQQDNCA